MQKAENLIFIKLSAFFWFLYKIIDDAGNVIMAFMDHNCEFEFNHCNKIKATISKLSEFNNVKQTSVSRVKFLD